VSYAHKNERIAHDFLGKFQDHCQLSKHFVYEKWMDTDIVLGEEWDPQIQRAAAECDFGLLLLSATYFNRWYITEKEMPHFLNKDEDGKISIHKAIIPVSLVSFNLGGDLGGLEQVQIFQYQTGYGKEAKAYSQFDQNKRNDFVIELIKRMEAKFASSNA